MPEQDGYPDVTIHDPGVAKKLADIRAGKLPQPDVSTASHEPTLRRPLESVVEEFLSNLQGIREDLEGSSEPNYDNNPLLNSVVNASFIFESILTPALDELLRRTDGAVQLYKKSRLYFGMFYEDPQEKTNKNGKKVSVFVKERAALFFDDGEFEYDLSNPSSFQSFWDRSGRAERREMAVLGVMTRSDIIKSFEGFAKNYSPII